MSRRELAAYLAQLDGIAAVRRVAEREGATRAEPGGTHDEPTTLPPHHDPADALEHATDGR